MATTKTAENERPLAGVIGFFDQPSHLIEAMSQVRQANYQNFDAYTPFPVHGLEAAQGLKRSPLPFVTLIAGITGCSLAFLFEYWTSAVDWPLIVGGKPFNSWPAFVPVMFELTVLFGGLFTVAAMFALNGLPNIRRKIFDPSITKDRFCLAIEAPVIPTSEDGEEDETALAKAAKYKKFDAAEAMEFLKKLGATEVRKVYSEGWF
jgi:hypothetical protein